MRDGSSLFDGVDDGNKVADGISLFDGKEEGFASVGLSERDGSFERLGSREGGLEDCVGPGDGPGVGWRVGFGVGAGVGAGEVLIQDNPSPVKPGLQAQVKEPAVLVHEAFGLQLFVPVAHSSISVHVMPLPLYPVLQSQLKPKGMFSQTALVSQGLVRHSLTSVHVIPSPSKPGKQEQEKLPSVSTQKASLEQGCTNTRRVRHSERKERISTNNLACCLHSRQRYTH